MSEIFDHFAAFGTLLLIRVMGFMAFVRLFTPFSAIEQSAMLQSGVAFALALPLVPDIVVALAAGAAPSGWDFVLQGATSLVAGASFAVLCSVPIRIAAALGEVIDNSRGLQANGPLNPVTRDSATPLSSAVTAVLSLVLFTYGWHLDIIADLYAVVPAPDLKALGESVQGTAPLWVQSVAVLGTLLIRVGPLLALLITVDFGIGLATKNLKSGDMGGAPTVIKVLIVAAWLVLVLQNLLSPEGLAGLRVAFHDLVSPLDRVFGVAPR